MLNKVAMNTIWEMEQKNCVKHCDVIASCVGLFYFFLFELYECLSINMHLTLVSHGLI